MGRASMVLSSVYHACGTVLLSLIKMDLRMRGQQHVIYLAFSTAINTVMHNILMFKN